MGTLQRMQEMSNMTAQHPNQEIITLVGHGKGYTSPFTMRQKIKLEVLTSWVCTLVLACFLLLLLSIVSLNRKKKDNS